MCFSWCSALLQAVVRLAFHPSAAIVYTGCLDGIVRAWDVRTGMSPDGFKLWMTVHHFLMLLEPLVCFQGRVCMHKAGTCAEFKTWPSAGTAGPC